MTERPQNVRSASILERSYADGAYNSRSRIPEARTEENQITNGPYRGSHRADSRHHVDDRSAARQRSSRVGRHHADRQDEQTDRQDEQTDRW